MAIKNDEKRPSGIEKAGANTGRRTSTLGKGLYKATAAVAGAYSLKFGLIDNYYDVIDLRPSELVRNVGASIGLMAIGVYNWSRLSDSTPVHNKTDDHQRALAVTVAVGLILGSAGELLARHTAHENVAEVLLLPDNNDRDFNLNFFDGNNEGGESETSNTAPVETVNGTVSLDGELGSMVVEVQLPSEFDTYIGRDCIDKDPIEIGPGGNYWSSLRSLYPYPEDRREPVLTENELWRTINAIDTSKTLHPGYELDFLC